jgi:zinc protease
VKRARGSLAAVLVCVFLVSSASAQESPLVPGATSTPPPPGPQRSVRFPTAVEKTLPNGLRVLAVRVPGSALVAADLTLPGGAAADPDGAGGVAALTASLLSRGTAHRSAKQVALALDALGATLTATAALERTDVTSDALAARFPAVLALMAESVREPAFSPDELTLAKQRATSGITLANGSPSDLAGLMAQRALFANPFGRPVSGTIRSVAAIDRNAVVAYHRTYFRPGGALLTIGGDLAPDAAFALAQKSFGSWNASGAAAAPAATAVPAAARVIVVDQPAAGRTAIAVARPGPLRRGSDWAAASIANAVLSGYSGRLNEEIRVKRGLSYGASSSLQSGRYAGSIVARTLVEHAKAPEALGVMLDTLASLGKDPASAEELNTRRTSLLGGLADSIETTGGLVRAVAANAFNGLPLDALTATNAALTAIDGAAVSRFAGASFAAPPAIVLVGDASKFVDALRKTYPDLVVVKAPDLDLAGERLTR